MRKFIIMILLAVLLAGCAGQAATPKGEIDKVRLPMGYIPNVQYAPFYVAVAKGFFEDAGIEIEFDYSPETDGVALVGAGELSFAVVSGEQVLLARAQGAPVVYVLSWWQNYPVAVASMKGSGIVEPADLKGKKIGLPGLYGASYIGLQALLAAGGLTDSDVTLDSIGYNQVEVLATGREDAVVIYANNEPIQLKRQGYELDLVQVADYTRLVSNGIIANEQTIANHPDLVRRMTGAVVQGIRYALANPDETFIICTQHVEGLKTGDQVLQKEIMLASMEFWKSKQLGVSDAQAWENMQQVLLDMKLLTQPLDLSQAYTNRFVTP